MKKLLFLFAVITLNGCSVMMAATPREAPDVSAVKPGAHRQDIERALGRPIYFMRRGGGDITTYQYISNDEASYERAATYAVLDGVTLGVAEFFTFGVEAVQGDRHEVQVLYDTKGRAISINETVHEAPVEKPEKIIGIDDEPANGATSPEPLSPAPQLPVES